MALGAAGLGACASRGAPSGPGEPPSPPLPAGIRDQLPDPAHVLDHAAELGLAAEPAAAIRADLARTQARWDTLAADLRTQTGELARVLAAPTVDEVAARREADDVIRLEGELKQAHLALRVRTRNALTEEQRRRLDALRPSAPR